MSRKHPDRLARRVRHLEDRQRQDGAQLKGDLARLEGKLQALRQRVKALETSHQPTRLHPARVEAAD